MKNYVGMLTLAAAFSPMVIRAAEKVQFNRDIRPILSENCFHCHGPDPGSRKAGLRLDTEQGFFEKTEKRGPTVVAGKPADSPLYQRILSSDPEEIMPPPESHKDLKPEQKEIIRRWIEEGAPWQPHWSFIPPQRPAVPEVPGATHPIDAFLQQKLSSVGLKPAPEADRRSLARRASFDLRGLPPSPQEVEEFVADQAPNAWERYLDRLLASPAWGEHRGRYWLDAARYADTHGLHFDNYREMWPYRDWVIRAFNQNMPFDQFTLEQLAGDLLPNPTQSQLIATGFHRCNITTNEGGTIEEENLVSYARDRVETTSWVWLGLTANCAVCHDHKFDPISAKDFYQMTAYFRNTQQGGLDGNVKDSNPSIIVPLTEDLARYEAIGGEIAMTRDTLAKARTVEKANYDMWASALKPDALVHKVETAGQVLHVPLNEAEGDTVAVKTPTGARTAQLSAPGLKWAKPKAKGSVSLNLQAQQSLILGNEGDFEKDQAFSVSLKMIADPNRTGALVAKMEKPQNNYRGWDVWLQAGQQIAVHVIHNWPQQAIKMVTGNVLQRNVEHHVVATYDGSGRSDGIRIYVDGALQPLTAEANGSLAGSIRTTVPLRIGGRESGDGPEKAAVSDVRIYNRKLDDAEIAGVGRAREIMTIAELPMDKRTPEHQKTLQDYYFTAVNPATIANAQQLLSLESEKKAIEARGAYTHVQRERTDRMAEAFVLTRGNYDQKADKVVPGPFSALHAAPEAAPKNRLGLAQWLLQPENPLTSRVTVNRFWQEIFGQGIVKTSEDFGIVGEAPSHPELLDWLAVEFVAGKWDVKKFYKLMMTSHAYRQDVKITPERKEKDPFNRLLSRGPRFRMDGEMVRDTALAVSGLLVNKMGGPSVKPYQPPGVWEAVSMPESNTRNYKADKGESLYRRSVYTFWKRAAPPAALEIFNATAREISCLRRERSNTPMQALVTMNDVQFIEAARVLATKALQTSFVATDLRIQFLATHIFSRPLRAEELEIINGVLKDDLAYYTANQKDAAALVAYGETPAPKGVDAAQLAAWTMTANKLLNTDEALNK